MYDQMIILSKHFPFNNGDTPAESYIEHEINVLSKKAKNIIVFACDAKQGSKITCSLPNNVEAIALRKTSVKTFKIHSLLKGFKYFFNKPQYVRDEFKNIKSLKQKLFLIYFLGKSDIKYSSVCKNYFFSNKKNIIVYNFWFFDTARVAVLLRDKIAGYNNKVKVISRAHRYDLYEEENSLNYLPLREWLIKNIDKVYPCSNDGTVYLNSKFPFLKQKIKTSFLGTIDYGIQNKSEEIPTVISCSRLVPVKRVDKIISALRIIDDENIKLKWIHFGGGALLNELKEQAKGFKNIEIVFWENVKNSELLNIYKNNYYKCFINVSESEGLPISIMEASSFGIPVIATDVGGTNEIIKTGENGYLIKKDFTSNMLAKQLLYILNLEENKYEKLRENARKIWKSNFEYENNINKLFDTLV